MTFWFTEKISYLLVVLTLVLPFHAMYQYLSTDHYTIWIAAPLWFYSFSTPDYLNFMVNPFGVIYILWYAPSLYIAKLAYDSAKKGNWTRYDYAVRIIIVLIVQVAIGLIIPPVNGYPPPVQIPLPIVGIIALLLTKLTVRQVTEVWEVEKPVTDAFD